MASHRTFEIAALSAAALILISILFVPPAVGLADDGDLPKVTRAFDFDAIAPEGDARWYKWVYFDYRFDPAWHWWGGFPTSEMLLVIAALGLNKLVGNPGMFDLRVMGAIHAAMFLVVLALFLPLLRRFAPWRRLLIAAAALLVFCDVMYACYFNSFYMDTAAFLFLLLTIVFYLRVHSVDLAGRFDRIGFVVACVLFVTSKTQHSLSGLLIALLLVWMRQYRTAVAIAALSLAWMVQMPPDYADAARFNVIFYQILPNSAHPSRDLATLGLDDTYLGKLGMMAYTSGSEMEIPEKHQVFGDRASAARLGMFYLGNPAQAFRLIRIGLDDASRQRVRMGNYDRRLGKPPYAQSYFFSAWSSLKTWIFDTHGILYGCYAATLCIVAPWLIWRRAGKRRVICLAGTLTVVLMTAMALSIACLADGVDFLRHLFMFNLCLDILALEILAGSFIPLLN